MNTVRGFLGMYYIQMSNLESDVTLGCLLWRIVDATDPSYFKVENYTSGTKMKIKYTEGLAECELEIEPVKKVFIDDDEFIIGWLDDNNFMFDWKKGEEDV